MQTFALRKAGNLRIFYILFGIFAYFCIEESIITNEPATEHGRESILIKAIPK